MVAKSKTKVAPVVQEPEETEEDFSYLMDKDATATQLRFVEWAAEAVGYNCDEKTVQIVFALRGSFQRSEFNQQALQERREERAAEQAEREANPPKRGRAAKVVDEDEEETPPKPKPAAKRGRQTKVADVPAEPKPAVKRGRPAAVKTAAKVSVQVAPAARGRRRPASAAEEAGGGDF
jgi:hypothetical protein